MNEIYSIQHGVDMVKLTTISNGKLTDYAQPAQKVICGVSDYV